MGTLRTKTGANIEGQANVMTGSSFAKGVLINGTPVSVNMANCPLPSTVSVTPANGDTVLVEYSLDDGTTWQNWPAGAVTAYAENRLTSSVTDVRITRSAGSGTTSRWSIA
jgi:hypothetical protein